MNREMKSRGKRRDTGKWVQGFFAYNDNLEKAFILETVGKIFHSMEVTPESVGQFTSKHCKGVEVYEGDVFDDDDGGYLVVEYSEKEAAFVFAHYNYRMWFNENCGEEYSNSLEELEQDPLAGWDIEELNLLGNIHDNPELLKGVE